MWSGFSVRRKEGETHRERNTEVSGFPGSCTRPNQTQVAFILHYMLSCFRNFFPFLQKRYLLTERLLLEERFSVPQPGTELCPVQCKCRVLITGLPENSITERILINIPSIKRSYEGMNYKHQDGEEKREKLEDFVDCFSLPPPHPHLLYVLYTVNFFN